MKNCFLWILSLLAIVSLAQENPPLFKSYQISYFGKSGLHPGLKASGSIYSSNNINKNERQFNVSPELGFFYHKRNHTGVFIGGDVSFRVIYKKGFGWEVYGGVAYLRTFLAGKTYEVNDRGEVTRLYFAGNNQLMPITGIGVGKRTSRWQTIERIYSRFGGYFQYPHNTKWLPNLNLEVGVSLKSKK